MPDGPDRLSISVVDRIQAIGAEDWDACAGGDNPFLTYVFLEALEASGSVAPDTGWLPQHLVARDGSGAAVGVAPMYLKSHSYGEYVFDHGWAEAYERAGGSYYPKLQIAVPFTPVTGPRFLVRPGREPEIGERLMEAAVAVCRKRQASSAHVTFPTETEWSSLGTAGWLPRTGLQYHWRNRDYGRFDDFLADLASRKRKTIKKERREAVAEGIELKALTGGDIEERHWAAFYRFYRNTSDRKWGHAYLERDFFFRIGEAMADRIVLVVAEHAGKVVAGALNLLGRDTLYGRNWGCDGDCYKFLHFEACYYRAIDFAIARKLKVVEAGAQGRHKVQRGYLPAFTYSAHWIEDSRLRQAVADFLRRERRHVEAERTALMEQSPFRQEGDGTSSHPSTGSA
jgi:predicted N-acyltransferase